MKQAIKGFKLFQPWATEVVRGNLKLLIRSFPTKTRGKVAVIATPGMDGYWFESAPEKELLEMEKKIGIVGTVEIDDCIFVKIDDVKNKLIELGGKSYWDYYPKYLIPTMLKINKLYVWLLNNEKEWKKPRKTKAKGITWVNLKL